MKTMNLLLGALAVVLALATPPALAGSLLAGAAGVLLMASAGVQSLPVSVPAAPVVHVVRMAPEVRVFELERGAGVVVFKTVGGKLSSRCYRA